MKLKNRLFGKLFFGMSLLAAAAVVMQCSSCSNTSHPEEPLPDTVFVSDSLGQARGAYFKAHKDSISHCSNFYFDSIENLRSLLQALILNGKGSITGLRIYIAETDRDSSNRSNNIALIFSPTAKTVKGDFTDLGWYQILKPGTDSLVPLDSADAERYVTNYRQDKKRKLDKTLSSTVSSNGNGETTSLLYDSAQINSICGEMNYQNTYNKDSISGMWIIVTAHTDNDKYPQRLNLEFAFAGKDAGHSPISIENINPEDFNKRINASSPNHNFKLPHPGAASGTGSGGLNTAAPCPPADNNCSTESL